MTKSTKTLKDMMNKNGNPLVCSSVGKTPVPRNEKRNMRRGFREKNCTYYCKQDTANTKIDNSCSVCFKRFNKMKYEESRINLGVFLSQLCRGYFGDIVCNKSRLCLECRIELIPVIDLCCRRFREELEYV